MIYSSNIKTENFETFSGRKNQTDQQFVNAQPLFELITKYQINFNQVNNKY